MLLEVWGWARRIVEPKIVAIVRGGLDDLLSQTLLRNPRRREDADGSASVCFHVCVPTQLVMWSPSYLKTVSVIWMISSGSPNCATTGMPRMYRWRWSLQKPYTAMSTWETPPGWWLRPSLTAATGKLWGSPRPEGWIENSKRKTWGRRLEHLEFVTFTVYILVSQILEFFPLSPWSRRWVWKLGLRPEMRTQ